MGEPRVSDERVRDLLEELELRGNDCGGIGLMGDTFTSVVEMADLLCDLRDSRAAEAALRERVEYAETEARKSDRAYEGVRVQLEAALTLLRCVVHPGYVADMNADGGVNDYYCEGPQCGQPLGKPHLENCHIAAALSAFPGTGMSSSAPAATPPDWKREAMAARAYLATGCGQNGEDASEHYYDARRENERRESAAATPTTEEP